MNAKEEFGKWVNEGQCPCCFPDWEYGVQISDVWQWTDEMDAWTIYETLSGEDQ